MLPSSLNSEWNRSHTGLAHTPSILLEISLGMAGLPFPVREDAAGCH